MQHPPTSSMPEHHLRHATVARRVTFAMFLAASVGGCGGSDDAGGAAPPSLDAPSISVLSSRPEHVTGGDALVAVSLPANATSAPLQVTLNGVNISSQFSVSSGSSRALVRNLQTGSNEIVAQIQGGKEAKLTLLNHPITGPVLSGPHLVPYECRTVESNLGQPLDADCTATRKISYYYRTTSNAFAALANPAGPRPADLASTTTLDGRTVPYIVRVDSGTLNRTIYRIAILDDPILTSVDPTNWHPTPSWNGKLAVIFGGGGGAKYHQGINQESGVLDHSFLSRGFALAISTELVNGTRANGVLQSETLMMLKEFFIEQYDVPKWTVGSGTSGGGIQQFVISQISPGLLDGLIPGKAFIDSQLFSSDCSLTENFFKTVDPTIWTDAKRAAVEGYVKGTCASFDFAFGPLVQASNNRNCELNDTTKVYHPVYNRSGARCTTHDLRVNIFGRDPDTGFARKPSDNVGVQYGLLGLKAGTLSVDEFLQLNEQIGGHDVDGNMGPYRQVGDEIAMQKAFESGLMNSGGGGLSLVPILMVRDYKDDIGDVHSYDRDFTNKARIQRAVGRSDHVVSWIGPGNSIGQLTNSAIDVMNKWLDAIVADDGAPLSTDKIVQYKPVEAVDGCFDATFQKIVEPMGSPGQCSLLYPVHSDPRLQAGVPIENDIYKCALKPINFADYAPATFTTAQQNRLRAAFPTGVCDYTKPDVGRMPLKGYYVKW